MGLCLFSSPRAAGAAIYTRGTAGERERKRPHTPVGVFLGEVFGDYFENHSSIFFDLLMQNNAKNAIKTTEGKNDIAFFVFLVKGVRHGI
jgi:hypothetical protein